MFKCLCIPVRDISCPLLSPPLQDSPGFFALQGIIPVSSLLSSFLLPLCPYQSIHPPPSSSVWPFIVRPSEVFSPPADGRPMSSPVFLSSGPYAGLHPPPTCAAGGTWLGCGQRGEGDSAPYDGLESLDASKTAR